MAPGYLTLWPDNSIGQPAVSISPGRSTYPKPGAAGTISPVWQSLSTGGKIGAVGGALGGLAGIVAAYVAALSGPGGLGDKLGGLIFVTVFVLVVLLIIFFVFRKIFGPVGKQRKLQRDGLPAEATILEVRETGWTVNGIYPMIKLKLEVRPPGKPPYPAEIQTLIGRLDIPQFQPGIVVPVKYDPRHPSNVALAEASALTPQDATCGSVAPPPAAPPPDAGAPSPAGQAQRMEEFLKKNDERSREIRHSGQPAPAVILQATPLNILVNGSNPAMTFILDVQPDGQPAFQAQVTGVIGEESVPRYQPGKIVYVRYDPTDPARVALDHS